MILAALGSGWLISYTICRNSPRIKDRLNNQQFILATSASEFDHIFRTNKEYLKKNNITTKVQLFNFCLNDLNRKTLLQPTYFHEKVCTLSIKQVLIKQNSAYTWKKNNCKTEGEQKYSLETLLLVKKLKERCMSLKKKK